MATGPKYIVLRMKDIHGHLNDEWKKAVTKIQQAIQKGRAEAGKPEDLFFVLDMNDCYAQAAIEAYINAAANDPDGIGSMGTQRALQHARDVRTQAVMQCHPVIPEL